MKERKNAKKNEPSMISSGSGDIPFQSQEFEQDGRRHFQGFQAFYYRYCTSNTYKPKLCGERMCVYVPDQVGTLAHVGNSSNSAGPRRNYTTHFLPRLKILYVSWGLISSIHLRKPQFIIKTILN